MFCQPVNIVVDVPSVIIGAHHLHSFDMDCGVHKRVINFTTPWCTCKSTIMMNHIMVIARVFSKTNAGSDTYCIHLHMDTWAYM